MMVASLGTFGRIWSATARHWVLTASGVSCAKAVAMKAETTRRPLFPAWASTFLMKWTRQRCHVAERTLVTAAFRPSWASDTTSFTPRSPAARQLAQELGPDRLGLRRADLHAQNLATAVGVDADRDGSPRPRRCDRR